MQAFSRFPFGLAGRYLQTFTPQSDSSFWKRPGSGNDNLRAAVDGAPREACSAATSPSL